jgi:hypothetical protein
MLCPQAPTEIVRSTWLVKHLPTPENTVTANTFTSAGTIAEALVVKQSRVAVCSLLLAVPKRNRNDDVPVVCFGDLAQQAVELCVGDWVEVSGRIGGSTYTNPQDGRIWHNVQLVAFGIKVPSVTGAQA